MTDIDSIDLEQLDKELELQINEQMKELEGLKIDRTKIGDPAKLTESISQIVWEQFIIQIAGAAGQDFIKQNNNLNLSLKAADHILTEDSFNKGEMPTHNFENVEKYQDRYDKFQSNFKRDANGNIETHTTRTGRQEATLVRGARDRFDAGRPMGSKANHTSMDHTVSAGEILRDKKAGAFLSEEEKIKFANSDANLNEIDASWNASKGDSPTPEWLDNPNSKGQKPREIFDMSEKDEEPLRSKDIEARTEWEKKKSEGEQRAIEEGKKSLRAEAIRSAQYTAQTIAIALLAKLTRKVFQELISWFMEKNHKSKTLIEHLKKAIRDFLVDFTSNVLLAANVGLTVVLTQLYGEIVQTIKKALLFVKVGGESLYRVAKYLKDPENENKPTNVKVLDIGKIVTIGLTTAGGIGLGMVITGILYKYCPPLAVQIPLLGSGASLIGIFLGGLISGVCGAIVLHQIDGALEGQQLRENTSSQIVVKNGVLALQNQQFSLYMNQVNQCGYSHSNSIKQTHLDAFKQMNESKALLEDEKESDKKENFDSIDSSLDDWDI